MHSSRSTSKGEQDTSVAKLLREKLSIAASMKSINEVIRYDMSICVRGFADADVCVFHLGFKVKRLTQKIL